MAETPGLLLVGNFTGFVAEGERDGAVVVGCAFFHAE
jgi:hypothetical protein